MLKVTNLVGFGSGLRPWTYSVPDATHTDTANDTNYTPSIDVGSGTGVRYLFALVNWGAAGNRTLDTMTIGGAACTDEGQLSDGSANVGAAIFRTTSIATVTGSQTVDVTFSGTGVRRVAITVVEVLGGPAVLPTPEKDELASNGTTVSVTVTGGIGFLLAACARSAHGTNGVLTISNGSVTSLYVGDVEAEDNYSHQIVSGSPSGTATNTGASGDQTLVTAFYPGPMGF